MKKFVLLIKMKSVLVYLFRFSISFQCLYKSEDYVQLLGGHGLDTGMMQIARQLCPFNLPGAK